MQQKPKPPPEPPLPTLKKDEFEKHEEFRARLEAEHAQRITDRKQRLKEKFDYAFASEIETIEQVLTEETQRELDHRIDEEFERYRLARESEIENRLTSFRYARERDLRQRLNDEFERRREAMREQLDNEFELREQAVQREFLAEIDAIIRNERQGRETDLDLLREETTLEKEVDMQHRLNEFRIKKEREFTEQLERQLKKREDLMKNRALIDVRKREAQIRAEIEAQLGIRRAAVRERIRTLNERITEYKAKAEEQLRERISDELRKEKAELDAATTALDDAKRAAEAPPPTTEMDSAGPLSGGLAPALGLGGQTAPLGGPLSSGPAPPRMLGGASRPPPVIPRPLAVPGSTPLPGPVQETVEESAAAPQLPFGQPFSPQIDSITVDDSELVAPVMKGSPPPRPSGSPPGRPTGPSDGKDDSELSTVMIVREQPGIKDALKPSPETSEIRPKVTMVPVADEKKASITPIVKMIPEDQAAVSTPLNPKVKMIPSEEE